MADIGLAGQRFARAHVQGAPASRGQRGLPLARVDRRGANGVGLPPHPAAEDRAFPMQGNPLAETDRPYRRLVEAVVDYAIYLLDQSGRIASWNPGARR